MKRKIYGKESKPIDPPEQVGCPFCGEGYITYWLKRKAGVTIAARLVCFSCRATGPIAPTLGEARIKWEARPVPAPAPEELVPA